MSILVRMKTFIFVFIVLQLIAGIQNANAADKLYKLTMDLENAILQQNVAKLMKYVSPFGITVIDDPYTYEEVNNLIRDKNSWLYKHLFVGERSVKKYFETAENLKIKIHYQTLDSADFMYADVIYQSSNYHWVNWVESCFVYSKKDNKWYFDLFNYGY